MRSGHHARPAVVCMREFQTTRTLRASSGNARSLDASVHHAVRPPSSLVGRSLTGAGNLKTRSQEAHRNSSCGMLRSICRTYNNRTRNWQQSMRGKTHKNADFLRAPSLRADSRNQRYPEAPIAPMTHADACGENYTTENDTLHAKASFGHFGRACGGGADIGAPARNPGGQSHHAGRQRRLNRDHAPSR